MSSNYQGKNVFGADVYHGKDGSIHHNKYDADRSWNENHQTEQESYNFSPPDSNNASHYNPQPEVLYSGSGSVKPPLTPGTKDKIAGVIMLLAGSWAISWLFVLSQYGATAPGFFYRLLSTVSLVVNWPGNLLLELLISHSHQPGIIAASVIPFANFIWLCLLGKACLKKAKLKPLFGMKLKDYKQLSWRKVSAILLLTQMLVLLSAKL